MVAAHVTFWGAKWAKSNKLSGGSAAFGLQGFAENNHSRSSILRRNVDEWCGRKFWSTAPAAIDHQRDRGQFNNNGSVIPVTSRKWLLLMSIRVKPDPVIRDWHGDISGLPSEPPGGIQNVTWSGTISTDTPGVKVKWQWGAAVYTNFSTDYNAIGSKAGGRQDAKPVPKL